MILQAWARLCKCLGQDFLPYMSVVMPPLLQSAQLKPDVIITSADSDADVDDSDDDRFVYCWCWWLFSFGLLVLVLTEVHILKLHSNFKSFFVCICRYFSILTILVDTSWCFLASVTVIICLLTLSLLCGSMETITLGDKRYGIKTSVLEEKATACNMLCCYAEELKEGFFPWIDSVYMESLTLILFISLLLISYVDCRAHIIMEPCRSQPP